MANGKWLRVMRNKIYSKFPYAFSLTPIVYITHPIVKSQR